MAQKDSIEKYAKISELAKDFNYTAKLYGCSFYFVFNNIN